jgi:hypothetical protein
MESNIKGYVSVNQAAIMAQCTSSTIRRAITKGKLSNSKAANAYMIPKDEAVMFAETMEKIRNINTKIKALQEEKKVLKKSLGEE